MIDIAGIDKAEVLVALYDHAKPQGMGWLHYDPSPMSRESSQALLDASAPRYYFDYVKGRVLKVSLASDALDPRLYDRDNGQGAAAAAITALKQAHG